MLLAGLWVEPRSGLDLAQWFNKAASHFWSAHHSSIYPTLADLERERFVSYTTSPSDKGPPRKVYALTEAGIAALKAWVMEPPEPRDVRDEQMVKALAYDLLPAQDAIAQLEAAREGFDAKLKEYENLIGILDALEFGHPLAGKLGPRLTLMHGLHVQRGYMTWCGEAIALLKARENPAKARRPRRSR